MAGSNQTIRRPGSTGGGGVSQSTLNSAISGLSTVYAPLARGGAYRAVFAPALNATTGFSVLSGSWSATGGVLSCTSAGEIAVSTRLPIIDQFVGMEVQPTSNISSDTDFLRVYPAHANSAVAGGDMMIGWTRQSGVWTAAISRRATADIEAVALPDTDLADSTKWTFVSAQRQGPVGDVYYKGAVVASGERADVNVSAPFFVLAMSVPGKVRNFVISGPPVPTSAT